MRRALELAAQADHATSPNPMVGGVVLDAAGDLAGEGYHVRAGEPHGESLALAQAGKRARGGTLYVSLEPCAHHGRTPPCAEAVLAAGIRRVVVALTDPDPRVDGAGIEQLRAAGVEVLVGVEEGAARHLNRFYLKHRQTATPYVTAKFAMSLDGRIATAGGESRWITGEPARAEGQRLRHIHDAVLVGIGTVVADDPELTDRRPGAGRQPLCVVVDSTLRIPLISKLLTDGRAARTLVATTKSAEAGAVAVVESMGAEVARMPETSGGQVDLDALMRLLASREIISVLAEGGPRLLGALFDAGLVDAVVAFVSPRVIGGAGAPPAVAGSGVATLAGAHRLSNLEVAYAGDDLMISGECSPA